MDLLELVSRVPEVHTPISQKHYTQSELHSTETHALALLSASSRLRVPLARSARTPRQRSPAHAHPCLLVRYYGESGFETSYLLSRSPFDGVEGTDGKTATPLSDLHRSSGFDLTRARPRPPARGEERRARCDGRPARDKRDGGARRGVLSVIACLRDLL